MSLSYTTGNPSNLTAGATASMTDISGPFTDIKTFLTDGSAAVGDTILTSPSNGVWRTITSVDYRNSISALSTTPVFQGGSGTIVSGIAGSAVSGLWFPPATTADITVASKTTRLRIRACLLMNAVAPGITLTFGLYPISTSAGSSANAITVTLGTVITGSTAVATTPTASTAIEVKSSSFDLSAVTGGLGAYLIGVVGSGSQAATSSVAGAAYLEMRHT